MAYQVYFTDVENLNVSESATYSLSDAVTVLTESNEELLEEDLAGSVHIGLMDGRNEVLKLLLELPIAGFNLFDYIRDYGEQKLDDASLDGFNSFVDELESSVAEEIDNTTKTEVAQFDEEDVAEEVEHIPRRQSRHKGGNKTNKVKPKRPGLFESIQWPRFSRKFAIAAAGLGVIFLIAISVFATNRKPEFDALIKQQKYNEAAKYYPNNAQQVEDYIFASYLQGKTGDQTLNSFQKSHSTSRGKFDSHFISGDYKKCVQDYEAHTDDFGKKTGRLSLVAYAYLKTGNVDKAQKLTIKSGDTGMTKKITQYVDKTSQIKAKQQEFDKTKDTKKKSDLQTEILNLKMQRSNI